MRVEFFIPGTPSTAGSKRAIPIFEKVNGIKRWKANIVTDDAKRGKPWRQSVQAEAMKAACGLNPTREGLRLGVTFVMPRPQAHYRKGGILRPDAPTYHLKRPDATKMLRAIEDALNSIIWIDDAQISVQSVQKIYGDKPGAMVVIESIEQPQPNVKDTATLFAG